MPSNMTDRELSAFALDMWANRIETGDSNLSGKDAEQRELSINALDLAQMKLVIRLRELAINLRKADVDLRQKALQDQRRHG